MRQKSIILFGLVVFAGVMALNAFQSRVQPVPAAIGDGDDAHAREAMEFLIQRDPVANAIPTNILREEREFLKKIPTREQIALAKGTSVQQLVWTERGPSNVGGRTRVLAADVANPGTVIAGAVAGGIWKTTNDGASWRLTLAPTQIHTTSCITQDTRSGKTNIWYVGTGEFRGSTTNNTRWGAFYRGDGIYKSTDNGNSWTILSSTTSGTPQATEAFDYVWNVATNRANASQDEVYAATWNGIYRSTNGGTSWANVQPSDSSLVNTSASSTDVMVTSTGVVYARTEVGGAQRIWRSPDGVNWTNIAPATFPTGAGRIVFGPAPSNPNVVYVFCESVNNTPATAGHQLWKYTYVSGNGSGTGGVWENRGGNLPGDLSTQTGYDMLVHVKPDDENFVLIGGTNLYRSTNGFASSATTATIGGYPYWPQGPHHPDLQSGTFKPTNSQVYYSGNDGGIQRANDITMPGTMLWTTMNNGFNVTQFYSVAISSDSGDHAIVAGAQDNGSQATLLAGMSAWDMVSSGDGTVVEMGSVADDRFYTQSQSGPLYRVDRSGNNLASFNPSGSNNALFVNPITLDPNNSRILYYGAGKNSAPTMTSGLWRNDDARNATSTIGWTALTGTDVGSVSGWVRRVSVIGISKASSPNVVYYGTTDGIVKRVDNATSGTPTVTDVTPPGLNGGTAAGGFVRCVAVDPTNSNKALVAFGNYNFQNLWYTTNGGTTWTDVEGNLSGPTGPSIRWATIFYVDNQLHVYLATSIGVLMTNSINGASTVWAQAAANEIGNVLIGYLDYRSSDRTLAVGTHARGVFTTQIPVGPNDVEDHSAMPDKFSLGQNYPNPFNPTTNIEFQIPEGTFVVLQIFDMAGKRVATVVNEQLPAGKYNRAFSAARLASGMYVYTLRAGGFVSSKRMTVLK